MQTAAHLLEIAAAAESEASRLESAAQASPMADLREWRISRASEYRREAKRIREAAIAGL